MSRRGENNAWRVVKCLCIEKTANGNGLGGPGRIGFVVAVLHGDGNGFDLGRLGRAVDLLLNEE